MEFALTDAEVRVLGCLMEKEFATPEYYPLSLNALVVACNQKTNRDPVVAYEEETVLEALDGLRAKDLVWKSDAGRVAKYEERLTRNRNLVGREAAVLSVLLLRGPQTPGEIRSRSERIHAFDSLEAVAAALDDLAEWGFVRRLDRLPGHKEARYAHLLGGDPPAGEAAPAPTAAPEPDGVPGGEDRIGRLEEETARLRAEVEELRAALDDFRRQFE